MLASTRGVRHVVLRSNAIEGLYSTFADENSPLGLFIKRVDTVSVCPSSNREEDAPLRHNAPRTSEASRERRDLFGWICGKWVSRVKLESIEGPKAVLRAGLRLAIIPTLSRETITSRSLSLSFFHPHFSQSRRGGSSFVTGFPSRKRDYGFHRAVPRVAQPRSIVSDGVLASDRRVFFRGQLLRDTLTGPATRRRRRAENSGRRL